MHRLFILVCMLPVLAPVIAHAQDCPGEVTGSGSGIGETRRFARATAHGEAMNVASRDCPRGCNFTEVGQSGRASEIGGLWKADVTVRVACEDPHGDCPDHVEGVGLSLSRSLRRDAVLEALREMDANALDQCPAGCKHLGKLSLPHVSTERSDVGERGYNAVAVGTFFCHGFIATPIPPSPPALTVSATPATLWPPNGRLVTVTVSGTITDADSRVDPDTAIYEVTDEYGQVQPMGSVDLKADGSYSFTIDLEASRRGNDVDGRHYTITVSALDTEGNEGSADAIVTVPHDQGQSQSLATR